MKLIECAVVTCDQSFVNVYKLIDHVREVHVPEYEEWAKKNAAEAYSSEQPK